MLYDNNFIMVILNRLNAMAYHLFVLIIVPIIFVILITREIVIDIKNKLFTLNLKRNHDVKKGFTND